MSNVIKSLSLAMLLSFTQIHIAQADELKTLTFQEYQEIKNSPKISEEKLSDYEINNRELIVLHRIDYSKKIIKKNMKLNSLSIAKLTSL